MITLHGIRLNQKGYTLYLTSVTVEELKSWMDADRIRPDIWKRAKKEGYQREPDRKRFREIAKYLEGELQIEETLFPNSIILNIRAKGAVEFYPVEKSKGQKTSELGRISINDEALPFYEVDGQHRIRGLIEAYKDSKSKSSDEFKRIKSFPLPLTILEGLDRPTEAMQFVVINYTQKKVDPALVLRILHKRYRDKGAKLGYFLLKEKLWRLSAVDICDELNSQPNSPWCDKIFAPGDDRKGRVISEKHFISTLETVYPKIPDHDDIKNFLPLYWRAISSLWKECVGENSVKYSLQRTNGTYVMHWLFPLAHCRSISLGGPTLKNFIEILKPINRKFPPTFWKRGGEARLYTSKSSQKELVDKMIASAFLRGKELRFAKIPKRCLGTKAEKTWDIASRLAPLRLYHPFTPERLNKIDGGATGVYILYSFAKNRFYVGRTEKADLKSRLRNHIRKEEFHIFNYHPCKDPAQSHDLECALFHLFPNEFLSNRGHPSGFEGRTCPFCQKSD